MHRVVALSCKSLKFAFIVAILFAPIAAPYATATAAAVCFVLGLANLIAEANFCVICVNQPAFTACDPTNNKISDSLLNI